MSTNKTFNKVQLDVKFTQASTRANLTSEENISVAFGKLSKWYGALVPTGGSSGQFLGWNSDGTAKWVSNPNTDTKVRQSILSTNTNHPLLLAYSDNTITTANIDNVSYRSNGIYANPSTGTVTATNFAGKINGHTVSIDVPSNAKFTDTVYTHPTYTSKTSGLYKITVDGTGHVSATAAVTASDLPSHTHNNYLGAVKIGNFWGMAWPDGTDKGDNSWIRTTRLGLIPYARNTDTTDGNVSSLGTSTWTFANGYINNLHYKDLKNVTVVAGNTAANGIDKMTGSFFFAGDNLIGGINDWVGIQAGSSVDKWQIVGSSSTRLLYRQNDAGGTDSDNWGDWNGLVTPDSIVGNNGISITKLKYSYGSDDIDVGVYVGHTNSVTAQTDYNKQYVKYDTEGHITESSHFVHLAAGTGGAAGWIKLATMKHTKTYDNTPIELTITQRGSQLTYRLHIKFKNANSTDPDIDKFVIAADDDEYGSRAYIIKTDTSTWDLYIRKIDSYEALAVTRFSVGGYFPDRMVWTWKDEQVAESEITGGVEATRYLITHFRQSDTSTENYRPIVMGATQSNDTSSLNATITGQGFVSNSVFVKPSDGSLYANVFSTTSYLNDTGAQLTHYGLYLRSYKSASLPAGGNYSHAEYVLRVYDGKSADNNGMLLTIDGGGLTIVGGGESAKSLAALISDDQRDSNTSRTRLDVGGTLNTAFRGSSEELILSSDNAIYFLTNCNTIANRKPVVLNTDSYFYPGTTNTGSIGTSSYYWNSAYIKALCLSASSVLTRNTGDAYYYAKRSDTDVSVGFGIGGGGINHGVFSFKLGGWMLVGDASNVSLRATLYNPSTEASLYALPLFGGTPSTGTHILYNNNGFRYSTLEGTASAVGIARLVLGNSTASGTAGNKLGSIRLYSQTTNYIDLTPASASSSQTITIPATTATMAVNRKSMIVDETADFASYSWHKFADVTLTDSYYDYDVTFLASITWGSNLSKRLGLLTMHVRTSGTITFENGQLTWNFVGSDVDLNDFVMVYYNTKNTSLKVELYYKQKARYDGYTFTILNENTRATKEIYTMNLYTQYGHGSAALPDATGTVVSSLARIKNAPGIYAVKGTQSASTSVWTGKIDVSELYNGLTIAYYLPYASTSTAVTLNLTLVDGTTTGAINCYVNNNSRLTTQYGAGSTIILTYWSAGSIKVSGTATTDNRWSRCDYNANSSVTQNFASANTNRPLLMSYYGVGNSTTTSQVVYRNDAIYANPSQGAIHAKNLVLGSPYSVDNPGVKGVITLYQAGSEILPTANIEAESGTGGGHTNSTIKIPTDRSGVVRLEEIIYSVTVTPTSGTNISNLTFSYGTPRYLKICTRIGSTYDTGVTNIFDIGLNTDVGNGVMLTWGTPGQSGVSTYIQYANVRISSINGKYSINFLTGSAMQLTKGSTPLIVSSPNIFIYEIIAVY